jgi:hypothetical protein
MCFRQKEKKQKEGWNKKDKGKRERKTYRHHELLSLFEPSSSLQCSTSLGCLCVLNYA